MRLLRFLVIGVAMVGIACALAAEYVIRNQNHLVQLVLARIKENTGLNIIANSTRLSFGHHLVVVLVHPRVLIEQRELMELDSIRVIVAYHSLIQDNGLPLYSLVLGSAEVRVPATAGSAAAVPRLGPQAIATLRSSLDTLEGITGRVELHNAALVTEDKVRLMDHLELVAYRQHRRPGKWPWLLNFSAMAQRVPVEGARLAGNIWLGREVNPSSDTISAGHLWFWGLHLKDFAIAGLRADGRSKGDLRFALNSEGEVSGNAGVSGRDLVVRGQVFDAPIELGDYRLDTDYRAAGEEAHLSRVSLQHSGQQVAEGSASVAHLYDPARTLNAQASGIKLSVPQIVHWLQLSRDLSAATKAFANRFNGGEIAIAQVNLEPTVPLQDWTLATVRDNLKVGATLKGGGFFPPDELKLPRVNRIEAAISYSGAMLQLTQGSAQIGKSSIADATIHANFKTTPEQLRYTANLKGSLDISELYPAAISALRKTQPPATLEKLETVGGVVPVEIAANGDLKRMTWAVPNHYRASINLSGVEARVKGVPSAIAITSGKATVQPGTVRIDNVALAFIGPATGDAVLDGTINTEKRVPVLRQFSVTLRSVPAAQWLPLMFNPDQLSAKGPIGGRLQIDSDAAKGNKPVVKGRLTLEPGELQLGFLRAPIITQRATLTLNGTGMEVSIPTSQIEGAQLQIKFTVPDFSHPSLRIDAAAEKLDFEVMRFIRLPWSRATPPHFFPIPVTGHITSRLANFDKLPMSNVAADFSHDDREWYLSNFNARVFGGHLDLDIHGHAHDDWIHMKGSTAGMNAKSLTALMEHNGRPPLTGLFFANFDLWANTDVNFFDTLAGTMTIEVRDGTLNRFVLLTRILSLIDLKSWITAQFPNPLVAGIPFKNLTGDFKGKDGDFYTDNLQLVGPLMSISASGDVKLGAGTLNMRIALVPFTTVNWIISKIPLMGEHIANGSSDLLAAYFQVRGPISNPTVIPKPIVSVANFVIQTLKLPINILKPSKPQQP
jgi:hypothetical protein